MSEEEQSESDLAMLKESTEKLREHFDCVQLFVTRYEPNQNGGTTNIHYGSGNWFARYGQVGEWLVRADETTRIETRKKDD